MLHEPEPLPKEPAHQEERHMDLKPKESKKTTQSEQKKEAEKKTQKKKAEEDAIPEIDLSKPFAPRSDPYSIDFERIALARAAK